MTWLWWHWRDWRPPKLHRIVKLWRQKSYLNSNYIFSPRPWFDCQTPLKVSVFFLNRMARPLCWFRQHNPCSFGMDWISKRKLLTNVPFISQNSSYRSSSGLLWRVASSALKMQRHCRWRQLLYLPNITEGIQCAPQTCRIIQIFHNNFLLLYWCTLFKLGLVIKNQLKM